MRMPSERLIQSLITAAVTVTFIMAMVYLGTLLVAELHLESYNRCVGANIAGADCR
jgi:hypothetical protein